MPELFDEIRAISPQQVIYDNPALGQKAIARTTITAAD
jgi:hypothetical protein